ncbi:hypothetical protein AB2B38_012440 [Balneola sp. MJW-20]|uniref:hypothetical protein n=1 Tax=Gracilimonas aurantiaca TaxID=3234185 RepID=UPI003467C7CB
MKLISTITILIITALSYLLIQAERETGLKSDGLGIYSVYEGNYRTKSGVHFNVSANDSTLTISTNSVNLYNYSDNRTDERVQKCNLKSIELVEATIQKDKTKIAEIFGDSPMDMDEYVEQYLGMHKDVLLADPKPVKYVVENTFLVDELSNHGHDPDGWRWTTYVRVFWEDGTNKIIRYNWQPKTYFIDEWGLDKPVPFKDQMVFKPRHPFRSRINVYDPKTKTTRLLRNIDSEERESAIPARFVSYNIEINQTVSVRFRVLDSGEQYMEIGALDEDLLVRAVKVE